MSSVAPGLVLSIFGVGLALLGRWGSHHAEDLVPVALPEVRRTKDLRSIRRGVRSCLLLGAFLAVNGVVLVVVAATNKGH